MIKKILLGIIIAFAFFFVPTQVQAFSGGGTGVLADPYQITTCTQLQEINNALSAYYELASNIDCTGTSSWNSGRGFIPIGNNTNFFTGSFDGQGFTINGLYIDDITNSNVGLFGTSSSTAIITNVNLTNSEVFSVDAVNAGTIVGYAEGDITNVSVTGNFTASDVANAGGLVGYLAGVLRYASFTGIVENWGAYTGGLVGYSQETVLDSEFSGTVYGDNYVGGIVGRTYATVLSSTVDGSIVASGDYAGGISGRSYEAIVSCIMTADVSSETGYYVGGIAGYTSRSIVTSNASGNVTGYRYVGGVVGYSEEIVVNTHVTGSPTIIGDSYVGGLAGYVDDMINGSSVVAGSVTAGDYSGGLVGEAGGTILSSWVDIGELNFIGSYVGGLAGMTYDTVDNCDVEFDSFTVTGVESYAGGLVGMSANIIQGSTVTATGMSGYNWVGGLVGIAYVESITGSWAEVNVTGHDYVGGLVGEAYTGAAPNLIEACHYVGSVSGNDHVGGLVGKINAGVTVNNCYITSTTAGVTNTGDYYGANEGTVTGSRYLPYSYAIDISAPSYLLPGKVVNITTVYSDNDGVSDLDRMYIKLDHPTAADVEYYATAGANGTGLIPVHVSGNSYITSITYNRSNNESESEVTITWNIKLDWDWVSSNNIEIGVKAMDSAEYTSIYDTSDLNLNYINSLTFSGDLLVTGPSGALSNGAEVPASSTITWQGLKVVYLGTSLYPDDADFDVKVTDDDGTYATQMISSGNNISLSTVVDAIGDLSDMYTLTITNLLAGGVDVSNVTFTLKIAEPVVVEEDDEETTPVTPTTTGGNTEEVPTDEEVPEVPDENEEELSIEEIEDLIENSEDVEIVDEIEVNNGGESVADPGETIYIEQGDELKISIPETLVKSSKPVKNVIAVINRNQYPFILNNGIYDVSIPTVNINGLHIVNLVVIYADNSSKVDKLSVSVESDGYVYYIGSDDKKVRIDGAKVYLYRIENGKQVLWEGGTNPLTTDSDGQYIFKVEDGTYVLEVTKEGFKEYESNEIIIEGNSIINNNIELKKKAASDSFNYYMALLTIIAIVVLGRILWEYRKNRKLS